MEIHSNRLEISITGTFQSGLLHDDLAEVSVKDRVGVSIEFKGVFLDGIPQHGVLKRYQRRLNPDPAASHIHTHTGDVNPDFSSPIATALHNRLISLPRAQKKNPRSTFTPLNQSKPMAGG
eukprot:GABV01008785.1.p2 GENE.GABV01008785.1~~GABV01008785.1.p2  ORF type:complete len:121 (-),score=28.81 GABV01008785.1:503-865(-)